MRQQDIQYIIEKYKSDESSILAILQDIQEKEKYLPREALEYIEKSLHIPLNKIYRIATFYRAFSLTPKGRNQIHVCMGTACHVRGAQKILDQVSMEVGIKPGETTKDGEFSVDTVNCLGVCASGPVVAVNGHYFGKMTSTKVSDTVKTFRTDQKGGVNEQD